MSMIKSHCVAVKHTQHFHCHPVAISWC